MEKGSLKKMALYALGIQGAMITFPIWFPFLILYWVAETFLGGFPKVRLTRTEWQVAAMVVFIMVICI